MYSYENQKGLYLLALFGWNLCHGQNSNKRFLVVSVCVEVRRGSKNHNDLRSLVELKSSVPWRVWFLPGQLVFGLKGYG